MFNRYTVRSASGVVLSKHRSYLDALDGLASVPVGECGAYIYSEVQGAPVDLGPREDHGARLSINIDAAGKTRLRQIAAEVGAVGLRSKIVGQPSIERLIRGIAAGEYTVVPTAAIAILSRDDDGT
jgi:hypothetical protein